MGEAQAFISNDGDVRPLFPGQRSTANCGESGETRGPLLLVLDDADGLGPDAEAEIELAAARLRVLTPHALGQRLDGG